MNESQGNRLIVETNFRKKTKKADSRKKTGSQPFAAVGRDAYPYCKHIRLACVLIVSQNG